MPAKARFAWAACEEWHVDEKFYIGHMIEPRKTYDDLLPQMLNLDELQKAGNVLLSQEHRDCVLNGLRVLVQDSHREHEAQPATEVKKQYKALEKALKETYYAAGKLGADAALNMDVILRSRLRVEYDLFDLLGRLRMIVRMERQVLQTAKQPDIVRDLVLMYRSIYQDAGGIVGASAAGTFVDSIGILNAALPRELRAVGDIGNRVKNAVEEAKGDI
jgi:hypothetical protein